MRFHFFKTLILVAKKIKIKSEFSISRIVEYSVEIEMTILIDEKHYGEYGYSNRGNIKCQPIDFSVKICR